MAEAVGLDPDVAAGYRLAARLLNPILGATVRGGAQWQPGLRVWQVNR
jgi:hypothetical protein